MNQNTLGDIEQPAPVKTQTSFTRHEIKTYTKLLQNKQSLFVLEKTVKITVQFERNVFGTQFPETNPMEFGEDFLTEKETL